MHSTIIRVSLLIGALLACLPVSGAQTPSSVAGRIASASDGKPIAGAKIVFTSVASDRKLEFVTDERGRFSHIAIRPGLYEASVECDGYAAIDVLQIDVRSTDAVRLNLKMVPIDEAPFKRQIVRYRRPLINTENATLMIRII